MRRSRPVTRPFARIGRGVLLTGFTLLTTCGLTACDSRVGIEGTDYRTDTGDPPAATEPSPVTAATSPVGAVAGNPEAAAAVARWVSDLRTGPPGELQNKCWTLAPHHVATMYADRQPILAALARPGTDDGSAAIWKGDTVNVVAEHTDIAAGYACPRVYPRGTAAEFDDADARHAVRRYLARAVGRPLDPADREAAYPLVCSATVATWDPSGSGNPTVPPAAANPDRLDRIKAFTDQSITSKPLHNGYISVYAPVITGTGAYRERTFTLRSTEQGYCIGAATE